MLPHREHAGGDDYSAQGYHCLIIVIIRQAFMVKFANNQHQIATILTPSGS